MKIDGNLRSIQSGSVSEGQARTGKSGASQAQPGSTGGPRVELSPLGSQLAGIEASKVQWVNAQPPQLPGLLAAGQVQALSTFNTPSTM